MLKTTRLIIPALLATSVSLASVACADTIYTQRYPYENRDDRGRSRIGHRLRVAAAGRERASPRDEHTARGESGRGSGNRHVKGMRNLYETRQSQKLPHPAP